MSEWYENGEKWFPSKFGSDDELGTLNLAGPKKILEAIRTVREGRVFNLSHTIYNGMPGRQSRHGPSFYLLSQRVYDHRPPLRPPNTNSFGGALCRLEITDHLGTHLDSLNHIAFDNKYYNGIDAYEVSAPFGTTKLGIDSTPPAVTRGVMVDISGPDGLMERGEPVSVQAVEEFLKRHDLKVFPGDAVFFNTGVGRLWNDPEQYNTYYESSPGIGYELAKWIADHDVSISGSDVPSSEVVPPERKGTVLPVHQYLITKHGVRLIDNIRLDELSAEKVYEFMFVCAPLKIKGATASPVSPLAII